MPSWSFVAVSLAPVLFVLRMRASRATLLATIVAGWAVATAVACVFDPSDVGGQVFLLVGLLPLIVVPVVAVVATRVARQPRQRVSAAVLAIAGWVAGVVAMIVVPAYGTAAAVWDVAVGVLAPALYASSAATYAATRPPR